MKKVVILQPMYFPWRGVFEQIKLTDVFVYYDDVQFPTGRTFINRVQIKTPNGFIWMNIPIVKKERTYLKINEMKVNELISWREYHKKKFIYNYSRAPYYEDALALLEEVLSLPNNNLAEITINSLKVCCKFLGFRKTFIKSSTLGIDGKGTERLVRITKYLNGDIYITGHGAKNYLDYDLFESSDIKVEFMNYKNISYPQLWGDFNPYVSILDLISNTGRDASKYINSESLYWKDF